MKIHEDTASTYIYIFPFVMVQWKTPLLGNTHFHNAGEKLPPPKENSNLPTCPTQSAISCKTTSVLSP